MTKSGEGEGVRDIVPAVTSAAFLPHPDLAATAARADELGLSAAEYVRALRRDAVWESALAAVDEALSAEKAARPEPANTGSGRGWSG
jgi:hypothetical protein